MRLLPAPALVAMAILVGGGAVACAATVEGNGSIAAGVVTSSPTPSPSDTGPSSDSPSPTDSATPTESSSSPTPSPSTNPVVVRQRVLCVLEQASIASINNQFNKTKDRAAQVRILGTGVTTIKGHLSRSGLPAGDRIRKSGQAVASQLDAFYKGATGGGSPSTARYNKASKDFQTACTTIS